MAKKDVQALSVEERKARVERVRGLDARLAMIENALLDLSAKLPALVREAQAIRKVIEDNTAPPAPATEGDDDG